MYDDDRHIGDTHRSFRAPDNFVGLVVIGMAVVGVGTWQLTPLLRATGATPGAAPAESAAVADVAARERSVYYPGCNEARAAGVAPIYAGSPGYRAEMDGDGDGIACEPHRR